jgi:hypothetical protein
VSKVLKGSRGNKASRVLREKLVLKVPKDIKEPRVL